MQKAGRNDPCPCGSGKKFKKCCEALGGKKAHAIAIGSEHNTSKVTSLFAKEKFSLLTQERNKENVEKNSTNTCE